MPRVPVIIVTGYLGAGKTTLLRHILDNADKRYAIVMNEFGEVGIDGKIIAGKAVDMVELSGGCVCCSISGEFEAAMKEILQKARPDVVVLETTGVAEPDAIALSLEGMQDVRLEAVVCVVDADGLLRFPSLGLTGRAQIEMADIILLNKKDLVDDKYLKALETKINSINSSSSIVRTVKCAVPLELLFPERRLGRQPIPHEHTELTDIESFVWKSEKRLSREKFTVFADTIPAVVLRAKGFVMFESGAFLFNYVPARWDAEEWPNAECTELVFIGRNLGGTKDLICDKLKECEI
jgi:G3E family GTPase